MEILSSFCSYILIEIKLINCWHLLNWYSPTFHKIRFALAGAGGQEPVRSVESTPQARRKTTSKSSNLESEGRSPHARSEDKHFLKKVRFFFNDKIKNIFLSLQNYALCILNYKLDYIYIYLSINTLYICIHYWSKNIL